MKNIFKILLLISLTFFAVTSCQDTNPLYGKWKLSSWYIDVEIDLNKDTIKSFNLLDEVDCKNKEILTINPNGTINSVNRFSPIIKISKTNNEYKFGVSCNEGSLGFASSYKIVDNKIIIEPNDQEYLLIGKQLKRVFKNAIKVYDSSLTRVIETKDLTLKYIN